MPRNFVLPLSTFRVAECFIEIDTVGEWGVLLAVLAPPPLGRDKSGPYTLAIAALGLHQQFTNSIKLRENRLLSTCFGNPLLHLFLPRFQLSRMQLITFNIILQFLERMSTNSAHDEIAKLNIVVPERETVCIDDARERAEDPMIDSRREIALHLLDELEHLFR
jgi:hypothetical protein